MTQRRVREGQIQGNLTEQQIARLDSIGMVWGNRKEIAWQHGFEVAKKYHDTYGNLMVPGKYVDPDGYPLGQWIIKTRQQKLNGRLKEERIAQLDEIGMVWNIFDAKWEKAYALAAAYYEENGNLNIPRFYATATGTVGRKPAMGVPERKADGRTSRAAEQNRNVLGQPQ